MRAAHEHSVLRWELRRSLLEAEIARLEGALADARRDPSAAAGDAASDAGELAAQLEEAHRRRLALGPCPSPKMG
jgi:hypothetical protein